MFYLSSKGPPNATVIRDWEDGASAGLGDRGPDSRSALISPLGHYDPSAELGKTLLKTTEIQRKSKQKQPQKRGCSQHSHSRTIRPALCDCLRPRNPSLFPENGCCRFHLAQSHVFSSLRLKHPSKPSLFPYKAKVKIKVDPHGRD